jgi:hypothetical protein
MGSVSDRLNDELSLNETVSDATTRDDGASQSKRYVLTTNSTRAPGATLCGAGRIGDNEPRVATGSRPAATPQTASTDGTGMCVD